MSVEMRRRTPRISGDSEEFSEDSYDSADHNKGSEGETDLNASNECQHESEYETLDEEGEGDSESADDPTAVDDKEDGDLSDSIIIEYEREEGDGQESIPPKEKKLDDDEDRRNPQYIPKRGTFYEHDDRTATDDVSEGGGEKETERGKESQGEKKKVWKEHENRWSHDRYNEEEQAPKSRDELVAVYGYDIRNEDAPPRARRRRKYGRGPNKYTRNWEDEEAYGKSSGITLRGGGNRRGGRGGRRISYGGQQRDSEEEFPPLAGGGPPASLPRSQGPEGSNVANAVDNHNPQHSIYTNKASERRLGRGGGRQQHRDAFPPLSSDQTNVENHRINIIQRENKAFSNNGTNNAWRKDTNQNQVDDHKDCEDPLKSNQSNWKSCNSNTSSSGSNTTLNSTIVNNTKNCVQVEDKRILEDNRWKRGERGYNRLREEETEEGDTGWQSKNRTDRRGGAQYETQTFTSSGPNRGRGRGSRGGGVSRQSVEFKSNAPRGPSNRSGTPCRSQSETRVSSHDEGSGSEGGNYQVNSQVVHRTVDNITRDVSRMSVSEQSPNNNRDYTRRPNKNPPNYHQNSERRQLVVPPRMQDNAANKPKRYSSQRQRSLPETGGPAYTQPHGYYAPGYVAQPEELEGLGYVQQPVYAETPQQQAVGQQPTTPPLAMLPPHAQPPAFAGPFPPPPFIPPSVGGPPPHILSSGAAPYISAPSTAAPLISYVPTATQGQFPPTAYQAYQGYTAVPTPQPPELYQPQGITYYSPEEQMARTTIQKRQSTAIPIVPPNQGQQIHSRSREESPAEVTPGNLDADVSGDLVKEPPEQKTEDLEEDQNILEINEHADGELNKVNMITEQEIKA